MIHPNYTLQLLNILLKTKPDDKYTTGSEEDQNAVMQLPFVTEADYRTVTYPSYSYDDTAFVSIDDEIKEYSSSYDTKLNTGSFSGTDEEERALAEELLAQKKEELMNKNVYNINNFSTTEHRITIPITRIDPDGPKTNKKLHYPVGARVSNFAFDDENPKLVDTTINSNKNLYKISLPILYSLVAEGENKKPELHENIETEMEEVKTNFTKELKAIQTYASAKPQNYYTTKFGVTPSNEEKVTITIRRSKIVLKEAFIYCRYGSFIGSSHVATKINYYSLEEEKEVVVFEINSWLFSQELGASDQTSVYPKKAFIGLFTKMPDTDGTKFEEPTWKTNDNLHTYQRMSLHEDLLYGDMSLNAVRQIGANSEKYPNDTIEHKGYLGYAFVDNKEIVLFPEILDEDGWGEIVGFGLFENEEPTEGETPYFWGKITDKDGVVISVSTAKQKVPLFRKNEFKVYLG